MYRPAVLGRADTEGLMKASFSDSITVLLFHTGVQTYLFVPAQYLVEGAGGTCNVRYKPRKDIANYR